jgi:hypothetical protein
VARSRREVSGGGTVAWVLDGAAGFVLGGAACFVLGGGTVAWVLDGAAVRRNTRLRRR